MNVLITGGLGFIGSALANRLCREHTVTVLTRSLKGRSRLKFPDLVDIREKNVEKVTSSDCAGMDLVVHCASTVDNYNILTDPYLDIRTNCNGTIAVLEACKERKARFVYVSTFFVYGNSPQLPVDEQSACEPLGLYPATKLCAEQFCKIYSRLYSFPLNICRLSNVYGPGEASDNLKKGAFNHLLWKARKGEPIDVYRGGDFFRDYLYVDDAIEALLVVAQRAPSGELYLIGSGEPVLFKDLIECLHRLTGRKSPLNSIPPPRFHEAVGIRNFSANIAKIRALGWAPAVGLEEGIKRTLASYE